MAVKFIELVHVLTGQVRKVPAAEHINNGKGEDIYLKKRTKDGAVVFVTKEAYEAASNEQKAKWKAGTPVETPATRTARPRNLVEAFRTAPKEEREGFLAELRTMLGGEGKGNAKGKKDEKESGQ